MIPSQHAPGYAPAPPESEDRPARPADTDPTRTLCVGVHLDPTLREKVLHFFVSDHHRAWVPCPHLDLIAVVRHARQARRRQALRDLLLTVVLLATVGVVAFRVVQRGALGQAAVVAGVVAALVAILAAARKAGRPGRRVFGFVRRLFQRSRPLMVIVSFAILGLISTAVTAFVRNRNAHLDLELLGLGLCVAFVVVLVHEYASAERALTAYRTKEPLHTTARARHDDLERRLESLADANLIVYDNRARPTDTFVGSGQLIGEWPITVDVERGRLDASGQRVVPGTVDIVELYRWLENAAKTTRIPDIWCGYRMYVDGRTIRDSSEFMQAPLGPPRSSLPWERLVLGLTQPGTRNRTCLCLRLSSWNGALVVSMFVRAELAGNLLHLQIKLYVLPGVRLPRPGVMAYLPGSTYRRLVAPVRRAAGSTLRLLLASPARLAAALSVPARDRRLRQAQRQRVRHDLFFDFGAVESLHEAMAVGQPLHSNAFDDLQRHFFVLEAHLSGQFERYLEDKAIDTSGIGDSVKMIITNQHNVIDRLVAKNVTFGAKSQAGDQQASGAAAPAAVKA